MAVPFRAVRSQDMCRPAGASRSPGRGRLSRQRRASGNCAAPALPLHRRSGPPEETPDEKDDSPYGMARARCLRRGIPVRPSGVRPGGAAVQLRLRPAADHGLRHRCQHLRRQAQGAERRQDEHQPVPRRPARPGAADAAEDAGRRHRFRHHLDGERVHRWRPRPASSRCTSSSATSSTWPRSSPTRRSRPSFAPWSRTRFRAPTCWRC